MTDTHVAADLAHADHDEHEHEHPSDASYVKIAVILAIFTLIEVGTYWPFGEYFEKHDLLLIGLLTVLMLIKFVIVVGYFMHLKFDSKVYRWMFVTGLVLALGVYFIVFFTEGLFT